MQDAGEGLIALLQRLDQYEAHCIRCVHYSARSMWLTFEQVYGSTRRTEFLEIGGTTIDLCSAGHRCTSDYSGIFSLQLPIVLVDTARSITSLDDAILAYRHPRLIEDAKCNLCVWALYRMPQRAPLTLEQLPAEGHPARAPNLQSAGRASHTTRSLRWWCKGLSFRLLRRDHQPAAHYGFRYPGASAHVLRKRPAHAASRPAIRSTASSFTVGPRLKGAIGFSPPYRYRLRHRGRSIGRAHRQVRPLCGKWSKICL